MKRIVLIVLLFLPLPLFATDASTRAYLRNQPLDAWVAMARGAVGDPVDHSSIRILGSSSVMDLAKFILALVANGADPSNFFSKDYVTELVKEVKGDQMGSPSQLNDDAWGLLALRAGGLSNDHKAVVAVRRNLLLTQNTDGGWGYVVSGKSDTNDTAAVMMALAEAGVSSLDPSLQRALGYLAREQNDDGGFSFDRAQYSLSDGASDAWVISALQRIGSDLTVWKKNGVTPLKHLQSLQHPAGCYVWQKGGANCVVAITAWAAVALEGKWYPVRGAAPPVTPIPQPIPLPVLPPPSLPANIYTNTYTGVLPPRVASSVSSRAESVQTITIAPPPPLATQDSDRDGFSDSEELARGYDPYDPIPCPRVVYSTTLKNPYGGARLAHVTNEACRARYVRREIEKILGERLKLSSRAFSTLTNAFLYGGYNLKDLAMAARGAKTVHPKIYRDLWVRRNK